MWKIGSMDLPIDVGWEAEQTKKQIRLISLGEVVVAQLVERSLPIPEVRGSTPVIGKILLNICFYQLY